MNDRFKFRGYWYNDVQKEWWVYDEPEFITGDGTAEIWSNTEGGAYSELSSDAELHLCQCTGLKDKNGNLIYEGDIVKETLTDFINEENIIVVKWDKLNAGYNLENSQDCEREVIGNIYENADLLESEEQ